MFRDCFISAFWAGHLTRAPAGSSGYHIIETIPIGGTEGWGYLTMNSEARTLYLSRQNYVDAVNADTGTVVGKAIGLGGTNGLLPVSECDGNPCCGRQRRMAWSSWAGSLNSSWQDGKDRVYINITDKNEISEVDAESLKVLHTWSLAPGVGPSGISMDRKNRRLFSACDNMKMIVMNGDNGKVVASLPTGAGTDASLFDPDAMNALASAGGAGTLTVIHEDSSEKFRVLEDVQTQSGA